MRKTGIKILIGFYLLFVVSIVCIVLADAVTSDIWGPFIRTTIIIFLFSVAFISGLIFIGRSEIVDCEVDDSGAIKLSPMIGGTIYTEIDNIIECNEYIHMFTVVLNIKGKKRHVRLSKKYFLEIPWA